MSVREAVATVRDVVIYVGGAAFFIGLAAWDAGREQFHNYVRWPGL